MKRRRQKTSTAVEIFNLLLLPFALLLRMANRYPPMQADIDAFYQSPPWKRLRYQVILKHGRECMCCGGYSKRANVDHIEPLRTHWHLRLKPSNLQVLCPDCNIGKGSWDRTDWRKSPAP